MQFNSCWKNMSTGWRIEHPDKKVKKLDNSFKQIIKNWITF